MMNRKAASILMMIFEILVVILVVYLTTSIASAYGKSETVTKINAAEDLRMMVNTLAALPGDAIVAYPRNMALFSFILRSGSIAVFQQTEARNENLWVIRTFSLPAGWTAEGTVEGKEKICLEKKDRKILLKECAPNEPQSTV